MSAQLAPLLLTAEEIAELVGSPRHARQFAWLRERGIPAETDLRGRPRVLRAAVEAVMMPGGQRKPARPAGPRLELLRGGAQ